MQPAYEIKFHPASKGLGRFGLNPYGQPIYRIVWADSRLTKVSYLGKMRELPRYAHGVEQRAGGKWVLEKWAPAQVIVGMTREQYEQFLSQDCAGAFEEYPERGDWELSAIFDEESGPFAAHVDEVALFKQLEFHENRKSILTEGERKIAEDRKQEAADKALDEEYDNKYEQIREEYLNARP